MNTWTIVLLVILAILIVAVIAMYFYGKRLQKRQEEAELQMEANKQTISMLVIDKKKLKLRESGLPQAVIDSTPFLYRRAKVSVVKAKVGPQITTLIADDRIFDQIPVKANVKATVSGMYITGVKGLHGAKAPENTKKKGPFGRFIDKIQEVGRVKPVK